MAIQEALYGLKGYQPGAGRDQPAQKHLASARSQIAAALPPIGYKVRSSGSGQSLPKVPWLAVLDPDVTKTAQSGLYVCYLFDVAVKTVFLSMNQGATAHRNFYVQHRPAGKGVDVAALAEVTAETAAIRALLDPGLLSGTVSEIALGSQLYLPRGYEAGNIAAVAYDIDNLPPEEKLAEDLNRFLIIYEESVAARQIAIASQPAAFNVPAPPSASPEVGTLFQPKDSADYFAWVAAHQQRKTRKHEALINSFASFAEARGWKAITKGAHPRDLLLDRSGEHLLIESKTVRANSEFAVREAIGQLYAYEYVYYPSGFANKVALFSSPVGDLWVKLLLQLSIDCIWLDGSDWRSSGDHVQWL